MTRRASDEGFTLIELLVAMAIMAIITTAIGSAFVVALRTTYTTARKLNVSNNAQLLSQYLVPDVLSADVNGVDTAPTASPGCTGTPATGMKLALNWTDARTSTAYAVSYQLASQTLTRYSCSGGGAGAATVVARNVVSVPTPVVSGATVSMQVTVDDPDDTTSGDSYTFTVKASRRVASNACTPLAPSIVLSGVPAALTSSSSGKLSSSVGISFATTGTCTTASISYQYGASGVTGSVSATSGSGGSWTAALPSTAPGAWTAGTKTVSITTSGGTASTSFIVYDPSACRLTSGPTAAPGNGTFVTGSTLVAPITVTFQSQGSCGSTGSVAFQYGDTAADSTSVVATPVTAAGTTTWTASIQVVPSGASWTAGTKVFSAAADTASGTGSFSVAAASLCTVTNLALSSASATLALGYGTSGPLSASVTATVTSTGTCTAADITVAYQYGGTSGASGSAAVSGSGTTWTATLPATAAGNWTTGAKPVTASAGASSNSATLNVNESCGLTTAIALSPSSVGRTNSGHDLAQNVQATFTTTSSCTSGQLTSLTFGYSGSSTDTATISAATPTTNADGTKNWKATIPANLGGSKQWAAGTYPVTVTIGTVTKTTSLVVT